MCGVFGYVGQKCDVGGSILTALKTLEYRGYDSWGLALAVEEDLLVDKDIGRINGYRRAYPASTLGVGHTRWATHGGVVAANAHPHVDCSRRIAVVHNGIIENHVSLRSELESRGHVLASETDSDVIAHLVEEELAKGRELTSAVAAVFERLDGYNAVVVMDRVQQQFVATKRVSPLVVGQGKSGLTIASDTIALRGHAEDLIFLEDDQIALVSALGVDVFERRSLHKLSPTTTHYAESQDVIDLGTFPDFLSKEVSEQPEVLRRLVHESRDEIRRLASAISAADRVNLIGCGTAGNASMVGTYIFDEISAREITAIPASEFRYRSRTIDSKTLVVALSQSGETVDVLDAMAEARRRGAQLAAIVNTGQSTLHRSVETSVLLHAGVEQCVLATKSYTAMLATLLLAAYAVDDRLQEGVEAVLGAATIINGLLAGKAIEDLKRIATILSYSEHLFVIGRGAQYPSALEAALKIKEVSYIHAEGFAAGELKHGVIALVEPGTPCLVLAPNDASRTDVLSGAAELKSRGGYIVGVGSQEDPVFDEYVHVADAGAANAIALAVPGQLLGYFAALARGNDPDRPRNLAKSVTVK